MKRKTDSSAVLRFAGAAALVIGSFLPWVAAGADREPWIFTGIELPVSAYFGRPFISDPPWVSPDPSPFASAGALLIALSIIGWIGAPRWPMVGIGAAVLIISAPVLVLMTIDREPEYFIPQSVGSGMAVVFIGGVAFLAGAILSWRRGRGEATPRWRETAQVLS